MSRKPETHDHASDFVGWAFEQAARLRSMPELNSVGVDVVNLADELEDLGRRETDRIQSLLRQALVHVIKVVADPEPDARRHWQAAISSFVVPIRRSWSSGYRQRIDLEETWAGAIEEAASALAAHDVPLPRLPEHCPYEIELFLRPGFDTAAAIARLQQVVAEQNGGGRCP